MRLLEPVAAELSAAAGVRDESIFLGLVGSGGTPTRPVFACHRFDSLDPRHVQERTPRRIRWSTEAVLPLLDHARARPGLGLLKVHTHPGGFAQFSEVDDRADRELFGFADHYLDRPATHVSMVALPDGNFLARSWTNGRSHPIHRLAITGDDVCVLDLVPVSPGDVPAALRRNEQVLGAATMYLLSGLSVGVVGCSGTGCHVVEQLSRLGIGRIVLVDPDVVEDLNLNRIIQAFRADADARKAKVQVMCEHIERMGLGTDVEVFQCDVEEEDVVRALATCDFLFGCMDSILGRDALNRIATMYLQPYLDLGVRIDADGDGGIDTLQAAMHYLTPGGSSLLTRRVYSAEQLHSERLRREDPEAYGELLREGYIRGAKVEAPAVISINGLVGSNAVLDFLSRVHPIRDEGNRPFSVQQFDIRHGMYAYRTDESDVDGDHAAAVGRGDTSPLLSLYG